MLRKLLFSVIALLTLGMAVIVIYPRLFPSKEERRILYWTDPMIPGDRSDRPGKSSMGMDRVPVYEDSVNNALTESEPVTQEAYYTCPMHPSVRKDRPGACPVCGMALVRKGGEVALSLHDHGIIGTVSISPSKQVLANVATTVARRMRMQKEILAVGTIGYAEPRLRTITMRFPGRLDKLYLTYTGQKVRKGDPVADVYSPEAISAQREFLLAFNAAGEESNGLSGTTTETGGLLDQSRQKLLRWGFTEEQIRELQSTEKVKDVLTIYSPISGTVLKKNAEPQQYKGAGEQIFDVADLSTVWMVADVFEYEMQWVKPGQAVEATTDAYPGRKFLGTVSFVSPTIDPSSRTVGVRAEFPNANEQLRVGMFVNTTITISLPAMVVVPLGAVLSTGQRNVVWVEKSAGVFVPRRVTLGERTDDYYQILDGIHEGESVVTSGGYLVDSESQLEVSTASSREDHK